LRTEGELTGLPISMQPRTPIRSGGDRAAGLPTPLPWRNASCPKILAIPPFVLGWASLVLPDWSGSEPSQSSAVYAP